MDIHRDDRGLDHFSVGRSAERAGSDAGIGQWLLDEDEAQSTVSLCTHMRERLVERLNAVQLVGDQQAVRETRRRLDSANRACAVALDAYAEARQLLEAQLQEWVLTTRSRFREAEDDRRVVGW